MKTVSVKRLSLPGRLGGTADMTGGTGVWLRANAFLLQDVARAHSKARTASRTGDPDFTSEERLHTNDCRRSREPSEKPRGRLWALLGRKLASGLNPGNSTPLSEVLQGGLQHPILRHGENSHEHQ